MKTMKLIYPLACALAFTLTTTGCHNHKAVNVTPIPGPNSAMVPNDKDPNTVPSVPPINPDNDVNSKNGIPVASINPGDYNEDRDTFAANTIHFAFDSAAIKSSEDSNLTAVADKLKTDANLKLQIEGNCDDRGTDEYNRSLGERRALAAREALAKLGVDPSRVRTISYGKDKPVDTGHDEAAWAKNRRDDFVLLHPKTGA